MPFFGGCGNVSPVLLSRHTVPNILSAAGRAALQVFRGPVKVPEEVWVHRQVLCIQCPQFDGSQCRVCTCFIALKTEVATESCPLGKWGPATRSYRLFQYLRETAALFYGYTLDRLKAWAQRPNKK